MKREPDEEFPELDDLVELTVTIWIPKVVIDLRKKDVYERLITPACQYAAEGFLKGWTMGELLPGCPMHPPKPEYDTEALLHYAAKAMGHEKVEGVRDGK